MKAMIFFTVLLGAAGVVGYLGVTTLLRSQILQPAYHDRIQVDTPAGLADRETSESPGTENANRRAMAMPATRPATRAVLPESQGYDALIKLMGPFEDLEEHESKLIGDSK